MKAHIGSASNARLGQNKLPRSGTVLLIAYGNSLRGDDGAGFILAGMLERMLADRGAAAQRIDTHQLTPELALDIAAEGVFAAIFLDTRILEPSDDFQLHLSEVGPTTVGSPLGHHLDASALMIYAGALLGGTPPPAWLITIPGVDFDYGQRLSEVTRKALRDGSQKLEELMRLVV